MSLNIKNPRKVAILLSVYNGEKYLCELIDSILNQTYSDFTLYIRNDGATDSTPQIVNAYSQEHQNVVLLTDTLNRGSKYSFLSMLEDIESKYYMFSDQDDVWLPDKVKITIERLETLDASEQGRPIIVHTDLKLVDGELNPIAESYWHHLGIPVDMPHSYGLFCHFNDVTGCAMAINHKVKELYMPYKQLRLPSYEYHDHLLALLTSKARGIIYPLHQPTILFRRHGGNETNPLNKDVSILCKPLSSLNYLKDLYSRHCFYKQFVQMTFFTFVVNKIITKYQQIIWKRKLA